MAQDNIIKQNTQLPTADNAAGNESGVTTLIPPTTAVFAPPANEINISASTENRAAKFKYPSVSEDVPTAGRNQYQ